MCTIALAKVPLGSAAWLVQELNHNCYNMYFYECLLYFYECLLYFYECLLLGTRKTKQQLQHIVTTAVTILSSLTSYIRPHISDILHYPISIPRTFSTIGAMS